MHKPRRMPSNRARIAGGALIRLLACVVLLVVALAAWREHGRAARLASAGATSTSTAGQPTAALSTTGQAPVRQTPFAQPPAALPWVDEAPALGTLVYQCTLPGGSNFQAEPCPAGAVTEWSREATPDDLALIAAHQQAELRARQGLEAQHAELMRRIAQAAADAARNGQQAAPAAAGAPSAGAQRAANCEAARQYREAQLAKAGLDRNFDLIRKLDDIVYDACKSG